ncbi:MAG: APC family permease [Vicinamibacterales bacterium]
MTADAAATRGRRLGAWAATALVVSEVVGVGILLTPAAMMRTLGGVLAPVLMWLAMGTLTTAGALCYAELATRFPRAGGTYVFLREGFGRRTAFVYGWMAMLVMDPGLTAALSLGFAQYLLLTLGIDARFATPTALVAIVVFAVLATRGLSANAVMLRWAATLKLGVVGVLIAAGLWRFLGGAPVAQAAAGAPDVPAMAGAVVAAFFAFGGWWDLGRMSEEVESPRRTMPVALVGGVLLVTAIYLLVTVTLLMAATNGQASSDEAFVASAGTALFGRSAARLLAAIVTFTVAGSLAAVLVGGPRIALAMARDGLLPSRVRWFDEARGSSIPGTLVQATLASVLVLLGSFDQILGYFVPAAVFFLGLSAAALFRFERPHDPQVFRVPIYPLPLVLFLVLILVMLGLFVMGQPTQTSLGAAVVLIGLLLSVVLVRPVPATRP